MEKIRKFDLTIWVATKSHIFNNGRCYILSLIVIGSLMLLIFFLLLLVFLSLLFLVILVLPLLTLKYMIYLMYHHMDFIIYPVIIYPVLYYYTRSTEINGVDRSSIYKYTIIFDIIRYIRTILPIIITHPSPITANAKENRHIICTSLYNTS